MTAQVTPERTGTLADAVQSARRGRYEAAMDVLDDLGGRESEDPRVLDLLARVHAQRGEFADADSCWSRALDLDPAWHAATAGRRRIAALQARRFRPSLVPAAIAVVAGVAVVARVAVAGVVMPAEAPPPSPAPDTRIDQLQRDLAGLRAELAAPSRRADQLAAAVTGPGVTVSRQGESVLVNFTEPLFTWSTRLSANGRPALAELGARLKPLADNSSVSVIGYGSTTDLGLRRAQVAADQLGLPAGTVNVRSAGPARTSATLVIEPK